MLLLNRNGFRNYWFYAYFQFPHNFNILTPYNEIDMQYIGAQPIKPREHISSIINHFHTIKEIKLSEWRHIQFLDVLRFPSIDTFNQYLPLMLLFFKHDQQLYTSHPCETQPTRPSRVCTNKCGVSSAVDWRVVVGTG